MTKGGLCVASIGVILIAVCFEFMIHERRDWEVFKSSHNCKVVAHIKGEVFNTITPTANGASVGLGSTSDKTGWLCDDGITYYR